LNKNPWVFSLNLEKDYDNNIYYFILSVLAGVQYMKKLNLMMGNKDN